MGMDIEEIVLDDWGTDGTRGSNGEWERKMAKPKATEVTHFRRHFLKSRTKFGGPCVRKFG